MLASLHCTLLESERVGKNTSLQGTAGPRSRITRDEGCVRHLHSPVRHSDERASLLRRARRSHPITDCCFWPSLCQTKELRQRLAAAAGVDSKGAAIEGCRPANALLLVSATRAQIARCRYFAQREDGVIQLAVWTRCYCCCNGHRRELRVVCLLGGYCRI